MEAVAKHLKSLEAIDFSGCPKITDVGAIPVVREMTELRCLRMKDLFHVTDETIKTAANNQPHLSELVVENDWLLHDESLQMICDRCPKMTTLNLAGCGPITDLTLMAAASQFKGLVRVDCSFLRHLTDVTLRTHSSSIRLTVSYHLMCLSVCRRLLSRCRSTALFCRR